MSHRRRTTLAATAGRSVSAAVDIRPTESRTALSVNGTRVAVDDTGTDVPELVDRLRE